MAIKTNSCYSNETKPIHKLTGKKTIDSPKILNYQSTEHDAGILQAFEHV